MKRKTPSTAATPVTGYFDGEQLERGWRYAYRPEFIPLLVDYVGARPGLRILDVGCGTGCFARLLALSVDDVRVVGVDGDEELVDRGRQLLKQEELADRVELQKGDAYDLPFPDGTFDLVTSHTLL